jgi:hypothetical protein
MQIRDGRGAIYATPIWLSNMKERKNSSGASYNEIDKYLNSPDYGLLFKINGANSNNDDFHRNASEFAKNYDMEIINIDGTMKIAVDSYMNMKVDICKYLE